MKTNFKSSFIAIAIFIFAAFSISSILISCSDNDNVVFGVEDNIINEVIYFQLNEDRTTSSTSSSSPNLNVEIAYNTEIEEIISITATEDLLNILNMENNEELVYLIERSISLETYSDGPGDGSPHTECIQYCNDKYTDENGDKIKGRGKCKSNCWVDTIVRVIEGLSPDIKIGL